MERTKLLHIKNTNDFKYYVIKFSELPHEGINEIECIPWMWIVLHRKRDLNVMVSYPVENPAKTEKRVKEREKHSKTWKLYKAVVVYANDSYEDVKNFTTKRMNEINYKHNQCSNNIKIGDHTSSASVKKTHTSERALKRAKLDEPFNKSNENQSSPTIENPSDSSVEPRIIASRDFFTEFFTLLRHLQTTPARDAAMVDLLRETLIQNAETMRKSDKLIDETRASLASSSITPKTSTSTGPSRKPKFILPPEYDENNSRWTLKHSELAPGLVELMPHTSVYINAKKLIHFQRLAKDCNHLARLLTVEIFTESALRVCSYTGERAVAYDIEGSAVRPGLDKNARTAIMTYVQEYGKKKGWRSVGAQSIRQSIYIKMHAMRTKYE